MKCLKCGTENECLICSKCRTADTLDNIFNNLYFYKSDQCDNPFIKEYVLSMCEDIVTIRKSLEDILKLFDNDVSEFYYCKYYKLELNPEFEYRAKAYLDKYDYKDLKSQIIMSDLLVSYPTCDFDKQEKWCEWIAESDNLESQLYNLAARFYAKTGAYDKADKIIDKALKYFDDPDYDGFHIKDKKTCDVFLNGQRRTVKYYRTNKAYCPKEDNTRQKLMKYYDRYGIEYPWTDKLHRTIVLDLSDIQEKYECSYAKQYPWERNRHFVMKKYPPDIFKHWRKSYPWELNSEKPLSFNKIKHYPWEHKTLKQSSYNTKFEYKYVRVNGENVREDEFIYPLEYLGENPVDYCSFWCSEANGKNSSVQDIYEIAAVKVRNGKIISKYQSLICPWDGQSWIQDAATKKNVNMETIVNSEKLSEVIPKFLAFTEGDILISTDALGIQDDLLSRAARYAKMIEIKNEVFDLLDFAAEIDIKFDLENNTREYLLDYFNIPEGHDSLGKAIANVRIYNELLNYQKQ